MDSIFVSSSFDSGNIDHVGTEVSGDGVEVNLKLKKEPFTALHVVAGAAGALARRDFSNFSNLLSFKPF